MLANAVHDSKMSFQVVARYWGAPKESRPVEKFQVEVVVKCPENAPS